MGKQTFPLIQGSMGKKTFPLIQGSHFRGLLLAVEPEDEGSCSLVLLLSFYPLEIFISSLNLMIYPFILNETDWVFKKSIFRLHFVVIILSDIRFLDKMASRSFSFGSILIDLLYLQLMI